MIVMCCRSRRMSWDSCFLRSSSRCRWTCCALVTVALTSCLMEVRKMPSGSIAEITGSMVTVYSCDSSVVS